MLQSGKSLECPDGRTLAASILSFPYAQSLQLWDIAGRKKLRTIDAELKSLGVAEVFTPGAPTQAIVEFIRGAMADRASRS